MYAPKSIARGDESLFWYSADRAGVSHCRLPRKSASVHTPLRGAIPGNIVSAYIHNHIGHIFYVLAGLIDRTLVYDSGDGRLYNASQLRLMGPVPGAACVLRRMSRAFRWWAIARRGG